LRLKSSGAQTLQAMIWLATWPSSSSPTLASLGSFRCASHRDSEQAPPMNWKALPNPARSKRQTATRSAPSRTPGPFSQAARDGSNPPSCRRVVEGARARRAVPDDRSHFESLETIDAVSDEMRALIEQQWPHLLARLGTSERRVERGGLNPMMAA
jgi:hypothetical protein